MAFSSNSIQNILFIRTDRLGDFLLNLPAIHALKETYPKAQLSVLCNPNIEGIIKGHPNIDEIILFRMTEGYLKKDRRAGRAGTALAKQESESERERKFLAGEFDSVSFFKYPSVILNWIILFFTLLKKKFDVVIISNPHKYFHLLAFLLRIPMRVGYNRKWGFLLTHTLEDLKSQSLKHEVEYNLDLVGLIGAKLTDAQSMQNYSISLSTQDELSFEDLAQKKGLDLKKPWMVINPYTTASFKQWPIDCFIKMIQKLAPQADIQIVLIGGPEESVLIKKDILPFISPSVFDFSGHLNLKQLAALLKKTTLLISNDSGPVHIAAAFHTKTVVLFGKHLKGSNPKRWGPWNPLNKAGHRIIQKDRITDIEVQDVWEHVQNHCLLSS